MNMLFNTAGRSKVKPASIDCVPLSAILIVLNDIIIIYFLNKLSIYIMQNTEGQNLLNNTLMSIR